MKQGGKGKEFGQGYGMGGRKGVGEDGRGSRKRGASEQKGRRNGVRGEETGRSVLENRRGWGRPQGEMVKILRRKRHKNMK